MYSTAAGQTVANLVVCEMNSSGAIKLFAGVSSTNVVVDLVGSLIDPVILEPAQ